MKRGCVRCGATSQLAPCLELPERSLQFLQDDLNLAIQLPHVQQEGDMVAVMLNDVVVHVDQDSCLMQT